MLACNNCLDNAWEMQNLPDRYTLATCVMCGHEVRLRKKGKKRKREQRVKKVSKQKVYENAVKRSGSLFKRANGNRRVKLLNNK